MEDWQHLSTRINTVTPSATLAVDSKAKALRGKGVDVISFGAGEPNFPTADYIVEAAANACHDPKNHFYTPTEGLPQLRQAIANKTLRDSGYRVDPSQVVVTNGGKQAVYETFQVLLDGGDEVIIPSPYWTSYPEIVKLAGGKPVPVFAGSDRSFEPDIDAIEKARTSRTKAIIVTSPSNPTGSIWSDDNLVAIARWAIEHHIWLVSDEIYEHLHYDGEQVGQLGALVPQARDQLIVLNGVAKTYAMPGWRVGWALAPVPVVKAMSKLQGQLTSNVSNISQIAALAAVSGPLHQVDFMRKAFDSRRRSIVDALNEVPGVECRKPVGAFYAFPNVEGLLNRSIGLKGYSVRTSSELCSLLLEETKIAAVPGEAFGAPGYLRFSYALADDQLGEGMRRFKNWAAGVGF